MLFAPATAQFQLPERTNALKSTYVTSCILSTIQLFSTQTNILLSNFLFINLFLFLFAVPICMPSDSADFTGRMATVSGWGRLKYGGGVPSVLQEVQVRTIVACCVRTMHICVSKWHIGSKQIFNRN